MHRLFLPLIPLFCVLAGCENQPQTASTKTMNVDTLANQASRKSLDSMSKEEIWALYLSNPCYLPLVKDSNLWEKGTPVGFDYQELFNDSLPADNSYKNRYLVADFNAILPNLQTKGVNEVYPKLATLPEFKDLRADLVQRMENTNPGTAAFDTLKKDLLAVLGAIKGAKYINFLNKVWVYKMIPITRSYSIENNNIYSAGQSIVMCEACKDTLKMVGRFATSAKRQDIGFKIGPDSVKRKYFFEYLPIKERRSYYAGLYRITSKNWETARKYDSLDIARDQELGGGNNRITFYQGNAELPNFLLLQPDKRYPNAMRANGIHEVALRELARGMLGTANSIGCLRVSDFGSKFLRWWVPQNCKIFVGYNDSLYHSKVTTNDSALAYLPFKNQAEGNAFRKWINIYQPEAAKILEISETGNFRNGYIIDGYYYFKEEYNKYLIAKQTK
jgi:hypothetical protein